MPLTAHFQLLPLPPVQFTHELGADDSGPGHGRLGGQGLSVPHWGGALALQGVAPRGGLVHLVEFGIGHFGETGLARAELRGHRLVL